MILFFSVVLLCNLLVLHASPHTLAYTERGLAPLQQISSKNGVLNVELNVTMYELNYGDALVSRKVYNNQLTGPTLRVWPGDRVLITLNNMLESDEAQLSAATNLHFHGLHISPTGNQNNPSNKVEVGESFVYDFYINENQPAGTFWYHPYILGGLQNGELAGAFIVEEPANSPLAPYTCPEKEIEFIVKPSPAFQQGATVEGNPSPDMPQMMVNGQLEPVISVAPGHIKRFRIINAGDKSTLEIDPPCSVAGDCCDVVVVAVDGVVLNQPLPQRNGQTFLAPWQSADWLVTCNEEGNYSIYSNPREENSESLGPNTSRFQGLLATLTTISWGIPDDTIPITLQKRPKQVGDLLYVDDDEITGKFVMDVNEKAFASLPRNENPETALVVDLRRVIVVNGIEEWTLMNSDPNEMKTMYFPINHVQIISYNKYRGPLTYNLALNQSVSVSKNCEKCEVQCSTFDDQTLGIWGEADHNCPSLTYGQDWRYLTNKGAGGLAAVGQWRSVVALPPRTNMTIRFRPDQFTGYLLMQSSQYSIRPIQFHGHIKERGFQFPSTFDELSCALEMGKCASDDFYPLEPKVKPEPRMTPVLTQLNAIFEENPWYQRYVQGFIDDQFPGFKK